MAYLSKETLREAARAFLGNAHPDGSIPVPIEGIVEQQGINIVPLPGLQASFETDAFTTGDLTAICVDQWVMESRENRYRFTLAHELGHIVLHKGVFDAYRGDINSVADWVSFSQSMPDADYSKLEYQAYCFAGLVLVPPHHLAVQLNAVLPHIRTQICEAVSQGVERSSVIDVAWESLVMAVAQPFVVSTGAIEKRLKFDGFSSVNL